MDVSQWIYYFVFLMGQQTLAFISINTSILAASVDQKKDDNCIYFTFSEHMNIKIKLSNMLKSMYR